MYKFVHSAIWWKNLEKYRIMSALKIIDIQLTIQSIHDKLINIYWKSPLLKVNPLLKNFRRMAYTRSFPHPLLLRPKVKTDILIFIEWCISRYQGIKLLHLFLPISQFSPVRLGGYTQRYFFCVNPFRQVFPFAQGLLVHAFWWKQYTRIQSVLY